MRHTAGLGCPLICYCLILGGSPSWAQNPSVPAETPVAPGREHSRPLGRPLGRPDGAPIPSPGGDNPWAVRGPVGSAGAMSITQPGRRRVGVPEQEGITTPPILAPARSPCSGRWRSRPAARTRDPPDGLTLDTAIERLVRENLALRARSFEIPQADADILTASLRANPLLYADSQLVPYGSYSNHRPGGPVQYDVNITYPLDVTHKREARTLVARRARRVLEAQYQDAVRLQIDNLYTAYIDVLGARETIRFAEAAREGLGDPPRPDQRLYAKGTRTIADVSRIEALHEAAEVELMDAEEALRTTRRNLGVLLNLPAAEAEALQSAARSATSIRPRRRSTR